MPFPWSFPSCLVDIGVIESFRDTQNIPKQPQRNEEANNNKKGMNLTSTKAYHSSPVCIYILNPGWLLHSGLDCNVVE